MNKSIAAMFAAGMCFFIGCSTTHHATKWEYMKVSGHQDVDKINQLADEGWIVVGFSEYQFDNQTDGYPRTTYLLKRPKK